MEQQRGTHPRGGVAALTGTGTERPTAPVTPAHRHAGRPNPSGAPTTTDMRIRNDNSATVRLRAPNGDTVEFDEDGEARTTAEVGEMLASTYDSVTIIEDERENPPDPTANPQAGAPGSAPEGTSEEDVLEATEVDETEPEATTDDDEEPDETPADDRGDVALDAGDNSDMYDEEDDEDDEGGD